MFLLSRIRSTFSRGASGRPAKIMDAHIEQGPSKRDYHKKARMTIRVDVHVRDGIKAFARENNTSVSGLAELYFSGLMWSKNAKKLRQLLEKQATR